MSDHEYSDSDKEVHTDLTQSYIDDERSASAHSAQKAASNDTLIETDEEDRLLNEEQGHETAKDPTKGHLPYRAHAQKGYNPFIKRPDLANFPYNKTDNLVELGRVSGLTSRQTDDLVQVFSAVRSEFSIDLVLHRDVIKGKVTSHEDAESVSRQRVPQPSAPPRPSGFGSVIPPPNVQKNEFSSASTSDQGTKTKGNKPDPSKSAPTKKPKSCGTATEKTRPVPDSSKKAAKQADKRTKEDPFENIATDHPWVTKEVRKKKPRSILESLKLLKVVPYNKQLLEAEAMSDAVTRSMRLAVIVRDYAFFERMDTDSKIAYNAEIEKLNTKKKPSGS
eukprot:TRINITY_DN463_c0_g1_i1.p3 TRINITY_DN463_c0_g1~~TRINITY_DN463_c0_g1_i1.p3  ORF type:complete len:342 (+),score=31.96 TRINITY_DN463_c0_g1_i1:22-1026(+)